MKYPPVPGLKYGGTRKWPTPTRPNVSGGVTIPQPEPSWSHGVDTQKYVTEGELEGPRY